METIPRKSSLLNVVFSKNALLWTTAPWVLYYFYSTKYGMMSQKQLVLGFMRLFVVIVWWFLFFAKISPPWMEAAFCSNNEECNPKTWDVSGHTFLMILCVLFTAIEIIHSSNWGLIIYGIMIIGVCLTVLRQTLLHFHTYSEKIAGATLAVMAYPFLIALS